MVKLNDLQNQSFEVKVIEVDREKNRLIFSEKAVSEEEALAHQAKALKTVKVGDILEGVVSGIMPFGVFVRAGIIEKKNEKDNKAEEMFLEGLVHISEISWEKVENPGAYFKTGDKIRVKVIGVDEKSKRLNLSVKKLFDDPWEKMVENYPKGSRVKGKITKLAAFGAFVNIGAFEAMIHISQTMDDYVSFSKSDALIGKNSKRSLRRGDLCMARIVALSYKTIPPKIGLTMRQPGLGKLEWIQEDHIKKQKEAAKILKANETVAKSTKGKGRKKK